MIEIQTRELENIWLEDPRIQKAREIISPLLGNGYDTQDLEHQVLFRMTTYSEKEAFARIPEIVKEQEFITKERMKNSRVNLKELFCFGSKRKDDWVMEWDDHKQGLYAVNGKRKKEIIFREITLKEEKFLYKNIIESYHYIHCDRCDENKGLMFACFLRGNKLPFAIQEVEPCSISRNYKKAVLLLLDINYHTTVEITRLYSVPNTPKNLISIVDKLVARALRDKGYEWMMTAVMPNFAKTKSSTIAGGMNCPIVAKHLEFEFFEREDGRYELCVNRKKSKIKDPKIIKSQWKLLPTIEMIKSIKKGLEIKKEHIYYVKKN